MSTNLRRSMKNIVNNYTEAEVKAREATSNDPWGASSSLMMELAELTFNVVAFAEVMGIIWKRLNDHGKNWRHVYKALLLLDYLVKAGSERVVHQCKENIHAIQTLRDFQYIDRDGMDQGMHVREKAKQLVLLLQDKDKLKQERCLAQDTRDRLTQTSSFMAYGSMPPSYHSTRSSQSSMLPINEDEYGRSRGSPSSYLSSSPRHLAPDLEKVRPQTSGEEELQLQLALAMSREESDKEERSRRGDESLLRKALEESKRDMESKAGGSAMVDLLDVFTPSSKAQRSPKTRDSSASSAYAQAKGLPKVDPWDSLESRSSTKGSGSSWAAPSSLHSQTWDHKSRPPDTWEAPKKAPSPVPSSQTWRSTPPPAATGIDPFSPLAADKKVAAVPVRGSIPRSGSPSDGDRFDDAMDGGQVNINRRGQGSPEIFGMSRLGDSLADPVPRTSHTTEAFLGPAAASLVNLDFLMPQNQTPKNFNPFLAGMSAPPVTNPFQSEPAQQTLSEMRPSSTSPTPSSLQYIASVPPSANNPLLFVPSSFAQPSPGHINMTLPQPLIPFSSMSTSIQEQQDQSQNPFL